MIVGFANKPKPFTSVSTLLKTYKDWRLDLEYIIIRVEHTKGLMTQESMINEGVFF